MHHDAQIIRSCEYYKNSSIEITVYYVGCQQIIQYSIHYSLKRISNVNPMMNYVLLLGQWTRDESFFQNVPNVLDDRADGPNRVWACSVGALSDVISAKFFSSL